MNKRMKKALCEIVFVFATVFIFRSTWMMLDSYEFMWEHKWLKISLVAGVLVSIAALYKMHGYRKDLVK